VGDLAAAHAFIKSASAVILSEHPDDGRQQPAPAERPEPRAQQLASGPATVGIRVQVQLEHLAARTDLPAVAEPAVDVADDALDALDHVQQRDVLPAVPEVPAKACDAAREVGEREVVRGQDALIRVVPALDVDLRQPPDILRPRRADAVARQGSFLRRHGSTIAGVA
jgi:hypothetical protein